MTQTVMVGTLGQVLAGSYGGATPVTYEEGGTNGFGVRMTSVRQYWRDFTSPFSAGGVDEVYFKAGHSLAVSTSNMPQNISGFTHKLCAAGTYDTAINAMFTRMYGMPFDSAVAGGSAYGGLTQPYIYYIYTHEMDHGPKLYGTDTAADFIAAWIHVWNRSRAVASGLGIPASRVRFCWNPTGFNIPSCDQYYPGDAYVDVIGVDPYANDSATTTFAKLNAKIWPWIRGHNKPMCYPETNNIRSTIADSSRVQAYWVDAGNQLANLDIPVEFVNIFLYPDSTVGYQINKVAGASASGKAYPLIHAGIASMITTLGSNAIRGAVTQALPSAPTGVAVTSSADGKSATMTWSANPGGDNVTNWKTFLTPGTDTSKLTGVATIAATPLSYTFTGLTPSTQYLATLDAINSAGKSGFGTIVNFTTSVAGATNHAPNIASFTAVPQTANPNAVDFNLTASDPDSNPITNTVAVTTPASGVVVDSFAIVSGVTTTRTYLNPGAYIATVSVADNGTPPLVTKASAPFPVVANSPATQTQQWSLTAFEPLADSRGVGAGLIPILNDLDSSLGAAQTAKVPHNLLHGLVASTFDPINCSGTSVYTAASGHLIWAALPLQDFTISGITLITAVPQAGTGTQLGIHDRNGNLLTDSAANLCSYGLAAAQTSVAVDGWLQTAFTPPTPPPTLTFPAQIVPDGSKTAIGPGTVVYVSLFFPAGLSTYPQIRSTSAGSVEAVVNLASQPRYGLATGQTGIVNPIPFGTWSTSSAPVFIGLF